MLKELLINNKSSIVNSWIELIIETYPSESVNFLRSHKDRFSNPIGYTVSVNAGKIFDELINDKNKDRIKESLNEIIKMRAVQDFSPSQAAGIILSLKKVLRKELENEVNNTSVFKEYLNLESGIDDIALLAFDLYMESKDILFQIRISEIKASLQYNGKKSFLG